MTDSASTTSANDAETSGDTATSDRVSDATNELLSGRYRLQEQLGEGAMGKVYRAEHVLMEKTVAIKVLRGDMTENDEIVARFQREARAAAALEHPNVCQATDFGRRDDGSFFLVMQYLEGDTLEEAIDRCGYIPTERALHIARQIASALKVAHAQGIVHRDLKPENIMLVDRLGDDDTVKIMDFGIARILAAAESDGEDQQADSRLTREGMVYGTPHYMSPEQVAGDDVDARTDLYALGVILFEILTGQPPYDGENIARVMGKHITEPIPALHECSPDQSFSDELQQFVESLLAKDLHERPESADKAIEIIDGLTGDKAPSTARLPQADAGGIAPSKDDSTNTNQKGAKTTSLVSVGTRGVLMHVVAAFAGAGRWWKTLPRLERRIAAGLSAAFLVITLLVGAASLSFVYFSADRQAAAIDDQQQILLEDDTIASAIEDARSGDRDGLEELLEDRGDDPHLRYLALEANLEANRSVELVEQAQQILELDDRYAHEPQLVAWLVDDLGDDAQQLLADYMGATIRDQLAERASTGRNRGIRNPAFEFLDEHDEFHNLERWQQLTVKLRQTYDCTQLEEILDELRAIGDPRAIPALETLQSMRTRGCGALNLRDCIGCIRGDLAETIDELSED